MAESFLGAGDVYIDRLDSDGNGTGLVFAGNATKFAPQAASEIKEQKGKGKTNYGDVIASATLPDAGKIAITFDQQDRKTLAMAFLGEDADISKAAGSASAEEITAILDKYVALANRGVSSVVVTRPNGDDASAWATGTEYAEGDYVIPTGGSATRFYKCTTAGTSDGTTEPTWPTDGSTVSDNGVVWQDMGTITAVLNTDYSLETDLGWVKALPTGNIEEGETLEIAYDYAAETGWKVTAMTQSQILCKFFFNGINYVNSKNTYVTVYKARINSNIVVDFLNSDFNTLEFEGTLETPTGYDGPFIVEELD